MNPIGRTGRAGGPSSAPAEREASATAGPSSQHQAPAPSELAARSSLAGPSAPRQHQRIVRWAPGGADRPELFVGPPRAPLGPTQQAIEAEAWSAIDAGHAGVLGSGVDTDGSMVVRLHVVPGNHDISLRELDGQVVSARMFPKGETSFEVQYQHGAMDPLDTAAVAAPVLPIVGAPVSDSDAVIAEIRQAVPAGTMKKGEHYEAILDADDTRPQGSNWPPELMRKAADISDTPAAYIRELRRPGTEAEQAFRKRLDDTMPNQVAHMASERYRWARVLNHKRPQQDRLPEKGVIWAARIHANNLPKMRASNAPEWEMLERLIETAPPEKETAAKRFDRAVALNLAKPEGSRLSDEGLRNVAELPLPTLSDSPRMAALQMHLFDTARHRHRATLFDRALDWNLSRPVADQMDPDRIRNELGISQSIADQVLERRQGSGHAGSAAATPPNPRPKRSAPDDQPPGQPPSSRQAGAGGSA